MGKAIAPAAAHNTQTTHNPPGNGLLTIKTSDAFIY
jgi:hypothetical protein